MPDSKEKQIQKELNDLSKSIDSILKKIESERQKLQPSPLPENAVSAKKTSESPPAMDSQPKKSPE